MPTDIEVSVSETAAAEKTSRSILFERLCLPLIALIFLAAAVLFANGLSRSFFPVGATVAGLDCAGLSVEECEESVGAALSGRSLRFLTPEGELAGEITLSSLTEGTDWRGYIESELSRSHGGAKESSALLPDAEALGERLRSVLCGEGFVPIEAQDARLVLDEEGARIEAEVPGNIPDLDALALAAEAYLREGAFLAAEPVTELTVANALPRPAVTKDDTALRRSLKTLLRYTEQELTVAFCGGREHRFRVSELASVLCFDDSGKRLKVTVDESALSSLLDALIEELGADGVEAKYGKVAATREYVYLTPGDTGFALDRDALLKDVSAAILNTHTGRVKAKYDYTHWLWARYGSEKPVSTCVEISLDNQYLWFYRDGELLTETEVTTGCIATNDLTRLGVFSATYLQADTYLSGPTWYDHVDYWIPFDGNIGLHDSAWREHYGADVYINEGSHGCINTPLEPMRIIFENGYRHMTVIVR